MANWDVFHGDRLKLERGLTTSAVREALARGDLFDHDLARPAGTTAPWMRLADLPELLSPPAPSPRHSNAPVSVAGRPTAAPSAVPATEPGDLEARAKDRGPNRALSPAQKASVRDPDWPEPRDDADDVAFPVITDAPAHRKHLPSEPKAHEGSHPASAGWADDGTDAQEEQDNDFVERQESGKGFRADDLEILDDNAEAGADVAFTAVADQGERRPASQFAPPVGSSVTLPVDSASHWDQAGVLAEVAEEEAFSLSRSGPLTIEELDLAPMVDVAFQLVLFFMVAAQTVLYKTLEIPKPTTEEPPAAVAQGRSRTLDDLKDDYILVEIDSSGAMKLDRQPIAADMATLVERLRSAREATRRKAMLLSADFATPHRSAVLAYDAANEIGLGIVIARPATPRGSAPRLLPGPPPATKAEPGAGADPN